MSTTNYDKNREAAASSAFQNRFTIALCAAASNIMGEALTWLSPPAQFYPDLSETARKQLLHNMRAALSYKVANNPTGYAALFAYSCAQNMNVYLDAGVVKKIADDQEATDQNYLDACGGLWNLWACEKHED